MLLKKFIFVIFIFLLLINSAFAWSDWKTYKTPYFTVFYKEEFADQAWHALNMLEYYRPKVEKLTGNSKLNTSVVIADAGTFSNGFTDPVNNRIELYVYPPSAGQLEFGQNWMTGVSVHEYTHMLHLTNVRGLPKLLTSVFGNTFYINYLLPLWAIEGIAVYSESNYSPYSGRLNDGFLDASIASNVKDKKLPSIVKATFMPFEYPLGSGPYIYGAEFLNYLAKQYGEEKFARFFSEYGKKLFIIELNGATRKIYGKTFPELWSEWQAEENIKYRDYRMEGERITYNGWTQKNLIVDKGKLYYAKRYPVKTGPYKSYWFSEIVERDLNSGKERCIASAPPAAESAYRNSAGTQLKLRNDILYYSADELKRGYANASLGTNGYCSAVHAKNLLNGKDNVLFIDEIRDFEALKDENIIYSKDNKSSFGSNVMFYDASAQKISKLFDTDYLVDRIVADEKRIVVSARKDFENYNLYEMNLKEKSFNPIIDTPYFEGLHSLSNDKLYFTANYDKKHAVYVYDFNSKQTYQAAVAGYADSPFYDEKENNLYFIGLTSAGFDIYRTKAKFSGNVEAQYFAPAQKNKAEIGQKIGYTLKKSDVDEGGYADNLATLWPAARLPIIISDGNTTQTGLFMMGQDAIGDFGYRGLFLYDSVKNKLYTRVSLINNYFAPVYSSIYYSDQSDGQLGLDIHYPFLNRLSYGLSNVSAGITGNSFSNFTRKQIEPYIILGFKMPNTLASITGGIYLERQKFGSPVTRTGFFAKTAVLNCFLGNEFSLLVQSVYDPDNPGGVFPAIRGYTTALPDKIGTIISSNYSRPLLQIRRGAWNEVFYIEDLSGLVFYDGAFSSAGGQQYSTGAELHLEVKSVLNLDFGIRYAYNKERQSMVTYLINANLPFEIGDSKKD